MNEPGELADPRIIVALDFAEARQALALADRLDSARCRLKVGKQLFTAGGPTVLRALDGRGFDVFLDLKFHDIPNTVASACRAAIDTGVWMLNVHASGGRRMMEAARQAVSAAGTDTRLVAVTVLTSLEQQDLRDIGVAGSLDEQVLRLARLAAECGLDGVVCSPADLPVLSEKLPREFLRVTPGVRPAASEQGDQKRIATPAAAVEAGAHYLVVGRPITQAAEPLAALQRIEAELASLGKNPDLGRGVAG